MSAPLNDVAKTLGLDRQSTRTSRLKPYLALAGIALVIVHAAWFWLSRQSTAKAQYQTQPVKRGNLTVMVSATGTLQPTNQVDVGSEISGTIKAVEVDYNNQVERGQVLVRIDTAKLEAQVKQTAFNVDDAVALARDVPQLVAVAPIASRSMTVVYGKTNWSTSVTGTTNDFFKVRNLATNAGRIFTESELRAGAAACVIGQTVRQKLFGNQDPIGAHIRMQKISCEVIGLLAPKGQSTMGSDQDDLVVIPLRALQRRIAGNQDVNIIQVSARENTSTTRTQRDIERLIRERRHLSEAEENDFNVMDMKEIAQMLTGTTKVLTALLGAVAAVSLLVGGIGIMNIMLVSVTERTREIGIRLAIGAMEREVLLQFLVEAAVLSSFGGVVGILVALAASLGLAAILNVPFVSNASIVVISFAFSAAVGLVFGYFPAKKAARLDPIEALRHE